ncbi:MAG: Trk family potassium uptake protein [Negativicutes bacterium]|nr:Trk family potassium uptake protein [Negativicutes bacterium]
MLVGVSRILNPYRWHLSTYQILVLGFAGLILSGVALLMTPYASKSGDSLRFVDALFTATSAVCVTGLVVVDTGTYFSVFGQSVILLLIQIGGLGVMTVATLVAVLSGKKINLKERLLIQEATNQLDLAGVVRLTLYIIRATLLVELVGGTILALRWFQDFGLKGIYFGYWHAVSAFCNAGFDLFGEYRSITGYVGDLTVNGVIASLIVVGGIGFPVVADLWNCRQTRRFSLHTKVVLTTTVLLIVLGAGFIFVAEYGNAKTLSDLPPADKVMASLFQSVTARTAGYNTVDIGLLREGTLLAIIFLMFVGASPSSMGGGVKTSTAAILFISLVGSVTGKRDPLAFGRQIPQQTVYKAFTIVTISVMLISLVTLTLSFTEAAPIFSLLFEVTSAFGTVGLSTGITPKLSDAGKVLITLTMFAGRVGTLTLLMALALRPRKERLKYPEGKIVIG